MDVRLLALLAAVSVAVGTVAASASAAQLRGADLHPMDQDHSAAAINAEFSMLQSAGATSVRFDIYWEEVEPGPGQYDNAMLGWIDWVTGQARAHGLKVILDLWATPCWASSVLPSVDPVGCGYGWWNYPVSHYPPLNPQAYGDFAAFAAKRWGASLAALELWNEPNGTFFSSPHPARDYAALVKAAYPAVKAVAPDLPVIMSLAGTDTTFLGYLYHFGVQGYYDGIAVHPYGQPTFAGLKAFRTYQLSRGDSKPLWATEVGWPSSGRGRGREAAGVYWGLRQLAALPYVTAAEIYEVRDSGTDQTQNEDTFGLLDHNLDPKPAWSAFQSALQTLASTPTDHRGSTAALGLRPDRARDSRGVVETGKSRHPPVLRG
jgi:hypothetical protein